METDTLVQDLVSQCWAKVSQGRPHILAVQIPDLITEIETQLQTKNLLNQNETELVNELSQNTPTLKLLQGDFQTFILKLCNHRNYTNFFSERAGVSKFNLASIISNPSRKPLTTKSVRSDNIPLKSVPILERQIADRESHISILTQENKQLQESNTEKEVRIRSLEQQNRSLQDHIISLEREVQTGDYGGRKPPDKSVKELIIQCNERDKTIKMLESMCEQYQKEFEKLQDSSMVKDLATNIDEQNKLISTLRQKLDVQSGSELQNLLNRVPILKQYQMYFRYKEQHKNRGIVFINTVVLVITCIIMMGVLRIMYFLILGGTELDNLYLYEEESDKVSMTWWKELQWLEYLIFEIEIWWKQI